MKKQRSELPAKVMAISDAECGYRPIPQAFWDAWVQWLLAEPSPEIIAAEELTAIRDRSARLPIHQQAVLSIAIKKAVGRWTQEKLDGIS